MSSPTDRLRAVRPSRLNILKIALGVVVVVAVGLGTAGVDSTRIVGIAPISLALAVIPGAVLRSAFFPSARPGFGARIAMDVVLSFGLLTVVGAVLVISAAFALLPITLGLLLTLVPLTALAARRRGMKPLLGELTTESLVVISCGLVSLALYQLYPVQGDRVLLGQFLTAFDVAEAGKVPESMVMFGTQTDFPIHYLFLDLIIGSMATIGGLTTWAGPTSLSAALRLPLMLLFGLAWGLAGHELTRPLQLGRRTQLAMSSCIPVLILLSLGVQGKFREPLAEAFAIVLTGISLWAASRWTRSGCRLDLTVSTTAIAIMVGVHLPGLVQALIFVGSWLLVLPAVGSVESHWRARVLRWSRVRATRIALVFGLGAAGGLATREAIRPGALWNLVSGAVGTASNDPDTSYRGFLFVLGDPRLAETPFESVTRRRWRLELLTVAEPHQRLIAVLAVAALVGLIVWRNRRVIPTLMWSGLAALGTLLYIGVGFLSAKTAITPANAITRNAFYVWFPLAVAIVVGVVGLAGRFRRPLVGVGAMVIVIAAAATSFTVDEWSRFRDDGWISTPRMTSDGQYALRWLADNVPEDSTIITPEITFGSRLVAERHLETEGLAVFEISEVMAAATEVLQLTTEFFLPSRSPEVLSRYQVDYVVTYRNGMYSAGRFGGRPILADYRAELAPIASEYRLQDLPYLRSEFERNGVTVYRVLQERLPSVQISRQAEPDDPLPPCRKDVCIDHRLAPPEGCPTKQLSTERGRCVLRREGT